MTKISLFLLTTLVVAGISPVKAQNAQDFKDAAYAVSRVRAGQAGNGCKTIPYESLQQNCQSEIPSVHNWCDKTASCSDGEPTREVKSKLVNEQQNESRLKDERHDLEEKNNSSTDDQEKAERETRIKKLEVEIEESGKRIAEFEKNLRKRESDFGNAIPILEKCIDARRAVQNIFSASLDKIRNEDDPAIKVEVQTIKEYYEEEKSGHGLALTAKEDALRICKENMP